MYRDGTGRTLVDILFSRKREVDGFPWLKGGEEIARTARRNKATGRLSAMLAKSVVTVLKGAVIGSLLVGLLDNYGKALFPELSYFTLFAPMAAILAVRPTGLFGRT